MTPPRDLADAQNRLDRVRDYAKLSRAHALTLKDVGRHYEALPYLNAAAALERIIGGEQ